MTDPNPITLPQLREALLSKRGAVEERPFGPDTLVFKVMGKMFALVGEHDDPLRINLKCDPNDALALRDQYPAIIPGYHMNKKHWNTVILDGTVPQPEFWRLVEHSYTLVVKTLKKADRDALLA